ncbi:MAG TPA: hypothetical protein VMP11_13475 [Verrucomicrobiae bacterium]|nr:hypothetical protein [Verrucomicrobiae bacterium]
MIDYSSGLCSNSGVMEETISQYLARIGAKGGKTTGKSKRRGGKAYYARIAKKGWRNRRLREKERGTAK